MSEQLTGRCMCGAVAFEFAIGDAEDAKNIDACHCSQCRQWSGHYWASLNAPLSSFNVTKGEESLSWFRSSDYARRGFCKSCGSALFWHADKMDGYKNRIAIGAGCIDDASALKLTEHIFVADKGAYYEIADGLPQKEKY